MSKNIEKEVYQEVVKIDFIYKDKKQTLKTFLDAHCDYVDEEEQKELEKLIADIDIDDDGRTMSVSELLSESI